MSQSQRRYCVCLPDYLFVLRNYKKEGRKVRKQGRKESRKLMLMFNVPIGHVVNQSTIERGVPVSAHSSHPLTSS